MVGILFNIGGVVMVFIVMVSVKDIFGDSFEVYCNRFEMEILKVVKFIVDVILGCVLSVKVFEM